MLTDWAEENKDYPKRGKIQTQTENQMFKTRRGNDVKFPEFEKLLVEWVWKIFDENLCVSDELIQKAEIFLTNLNNGKPENEKLN